MSVAELSFGTSRAEVSRLIKYVESLGLRVTEINSSGHRKVQDPSTGAFLFSISSSPTDRNWYLSIFRHLRRLGLLERREPTKGRRRKEKHGAIDLEALARAQAQARAAGAHVPELSDIEDSPTFLKRVVMSGTKTTGYGAIAQEEAIDIMAAVDSPRINSTKQRLRKTLEEKGVELHERARARYKAEGKNFTAKGETGGTISEFVHIAMTEVGPQRNLRMWKNENSGYQAIYAFSKNDDISLSLWAINLIEATLDHLDGLKWNVVDPDRIQKPVEKVKPVEPQVPTPEPTPEPEPQVTHTHMPQFHMPEPAPIELPMTTEIFAYASLDEMRLTYFQKLLSMLDNSEDKTMDKILTRLDKLVGIDAEV